MEMPACQIGDVLRQRDRSSGNVANEALGATDRALAEFLHALEMTGRLSGRFGRGRRCARPMLRLHAFKRLFLGRAFRAGHVIDLAVRRGDLELRHHFSLTVQPSSPLAGAAPPLPLI